MSLLVFLWGILSFLSLWRTLHLRMQETWRSSFITSSLLWAVMLWMGAEALSLLGQINFYGFLTICILSSLVLFILAFKSTKKELLILKEIKLPIICKDKHFLFLLLILTITLFTALAYPPTTWDSMTYHLPRVEHWLQNGTINHYYTSIDRQLFSAPFAEIVILYGRALTGDDWLMNTGQWLAFAASTLVLSQIAFRLGLSRRMQVITTLMFATLPMAIVQASSTQNDLTTTLWLLCLLERFMKWRKDGRIQSSIEVGLALGLAVLTKGTGYTIGLPIVLLFAFFSIKDYKKHLLGAVLAACIFLAINMPHYVRNYQEFENPLAANSGTISPFTPQAFALSSISNIYSHIPIPFYKAEAINKKLAGVDKQVYPFGALAVYSLKDVNSALKPIGLFHEDLTKNTLFTILALISIILVFRQKTHRRYTLLAISCFLTFSFCTPWQPWIMRLQLPLFAIAAPVVAIALGGLKNEKLRLAILYTICAFAFLPLFLNFSRPVIASKTMPILAGRTSGNSIWNTTRGELVFTDRPTLYDRYQASSTKIINHRAKHIGLLIGADAWEYPLWRQSRGQNIQITHQQPDSINSNIDMLFLFEKTHPQLEADTIQPQIFIPNSSTTSEWKYIR